MTDSQYTDITMVVDRSGSMQSIRDDAEGAINAFVADQKKGPGRATFTLIQFDNTAETVIDHQPIEAVPDYKLVPRFSTALRDAWGFAIASTGERLAALPEDKRPANVVIAIVTDGHENASREYGADQLKEMVEHQQEKYGWTFLFLAANQDAVAKGMEYGLNRGSTITYAATAQGTQSVYASTSGLVTGLRAGGKFTGFTEADRKAAVTAP